jgi:hypothetical protein
MSPLFTRTIELRVTNGGEEVDSVVVAFGPDEVVPSLKSIYEHPDMGPLIVMALWPAGSVPGYLNDLTFDAPQGSIVARLRVPPQRQVVGSPE